MRPTSGPSVMLNGLAIESFYVGLYGVIYKRKHFSGGDEKSIATIMLRDRTSAVQ